MELNNFIPLNAEGFVDKVLFFFQPKHLNEILENLKKGRDKASNLFNYAVKYGLPLVQTQICIGHFLHKIEKILNKPIEQIGEKYEFIELTELLDSETLANLRNEFIEFVKNYSIEDRTPDDLNCEKIARLEIAMMNMQPDLSDVFSEKVIVQTSEFLFYVIDENKIDEINFICNMIDNLSLDNNTDDDTTKFAKLVLFLNDFMFRKNNIREFIDKSFDYPLNLLYDISKDWSCCVSQSFVNHNVSKPGIENYAKFLLDNLQTILGHQIDLNSNKTINKLLDKVKLNTLKEEAIAFIKDCGLKIYNYEMINKKYNPCNFISKALPWDYFYNNFFDTETPLFSEKEDNLSKKFYFIYQTKQINKLVEYFRYMIPTNPTQFTDEEIRKVIMYLKEIVDINHDKIAIKSFFNLKYAKILLSQIYQTRIETDDLNNFFIEFNNKHPGVMREPIPQQTNLNNQRNLLP